MNQAGTQVNDAARYRWLVLAVFVLSTAINYLDRATLSALAPVLIDEFHLSNAQYGLIGSAFSLTYAASAPFAGLLIDRIGLNRAISFAVGLWSCAGIATGLTSGLGGLVGCRAVLGAAEAAGIPAAGKAIHQYLRPGERALGNAVNQAGVSLGSVVAPLLATWIALRSGWRHAFVVTGVLGLAWIPLWIWVSRRAPAAPVPAQHRGGRCGHVARPPPLGVCRGQRVEHGGLLLLVLLDLEVHGGRVSPDAPAGGVVRLDSAGICVLRRLPGRLALPAIGGTRSGGAGRALPRVPGGRRGFSGHRRPAVGAHARVGIGRNFAQHLRRGGLQRQHVHLAAGYLWRRAGGVRHFHSGVELWRDFDHPRPGNRRGDRRPRILAGDGGGGVHPAGGVRRAVVHEVHAMAVAFTPLMACAVLWFTRSTR